MPLYIHLTAAVRARAPLTITIHYASKFIWLLRVHGLIFDEVFIIFSVRHIFICPSPSFFPFFISKVKSASIVKLGNVVIFRRKYADAVIKKHVFMLSIYTTITTCRFCFRLPLVIYIHFYSRLAHRF